MVAADTTPVPAARCGTCIAFAFFIAASSSEHEVPAVSHADGAGTSSILHKMKEFAACFVRSKTTCAASLLLAGGG